MGPSMDVLHDDDPSADLRAEEPPDDYLGVPALADEMPAHINKEMPF